MNNKKRNFLISTILIFLAVVFTIFVKVVDVKPIGVNMIWYHITDWLGLVPIFIAMVYALLDLFN